MHHLTLSAASIAVASVGMFDSLALFVGKLVIIASLIWSGYSLITYLIRRSAPPAKPASLLTRSTPTPVPAPVPAPIAAPLATNAEATIPTAIVAVIAAAVQTMLDEKHRIISIKPQDSSWEKAGRQAILSSHRIR